jgi:hypothetical protein
MYTYLLLSHTTVHHIHIQGSHHALVPFTYYYSRTIQHTSLHTSLKFPNFLLIDTNLLYHELFLYLQEMYLLGTELQIKKIQSIQCVAVAMPPYEVIMHSFPLLIIEWIFLFNNHKNSILTFVVTFVSSRNVCGGNFNVMFLSFCS